MADTKGVLLGMLAETPLHAGTGQSAGVVDLPVSREGATRLPQIPETGLKGALRQWAKEADPDGLPRFKGDIVDRLFGKNEADIGAGELMISTARLLCLPVRRLDGPYAWVTTPYLLERLRRDCERLGITSTVPKLHVDPDDKLLVADDSSGTIFLEEYSFTPSNLADVKPDGKGKTATALLGEALGKLIADDDLHRRLMKQIAVMSDREFVWFAENALPVDARNELDDAKMSKNLWYEETVPPDALFYAVILPRTAANGAQERWNEFFTALDKDGYLQVGGNESVGQGWVRLSVQREVA